MASVWLAGSRILAIGSAVVIAPVLVSELGAAAFGVWVVLLAATGLFGALGSGSEMVAARVIAGMEVRGIDTRKPVVIAVTLAAAEAGILTVALIILAPFLVAGTSVPEPAQAEAVEAMRWIALAYVLERVTRAASGCLSGLGRHRARALVGVFVPLLFAVAGTAVLLSGGGLVALSLVYLLTAVAGAVAAVFLLRDAPGGDAVDARETARTLWRLGRPRQLSQAAFLVALLGERVLISQFASEIAAGRFAAASTLVAGTTMILLFALNPLGPELAARAAAEGPAAVRSALRRAERTTALLAGACLGALAACGGPLMAAWLGPELEAGQYIAVLVPGFFLWLLARVGFHAAAALDEPWLEARTAAWAVALNLTLALLVLELFGPAAAGIATSVSLLLWAAMFARSSRALLGAPPTLEILAPGIVAAVIAAPLAIGAGLLFSPDEGSRWTQAAIAVILALAFLALYAAAMVRWGSRRAEV